MEKLPKKALQQSNIKKCYLKFYKNLDFFKISCADMWKTPQAAAHSLWKTLWKLLIMRCFCVFLFHISHRIGCGKRARTFFRKTIDSMWVHRFTPLCFPQADAE